MELAAGSYIAVLAAWGTTDAQLVDGYTGAALSTRNSSGTYTLSISEPDVWVDSRDANGGYGLVGRSIAIGASMSELYRVIDNNGYSLTIESSSDLSDVVGSSFVGVHELTKLSVSGGAAVSFGDDLVVLESVGDLVAEGSSLTVGAFDSGTYATLLAAAPAGTLNQQRLPSGQNIVLDGQTAQFDTLSVASLTLTNGSVLIADTINVAGDMNIELGSEVQLPVSEVGVPVPMHIVVDGTLYIDGTSTINLDGKGYPGGEGPTDSAAQFRCHGGRTTSIADCEAGDFSLVAMAGAGGQDAALFGGGFVHLEADTVIINGVVTANAIDSNDAVAAGAGGGIRITSNAISGFGTVRANGGAGAAPGTGGRVSLSSAAADGLSLQAKAGTDSDLFDEGSAGAGTVFENSDFGDGDITVDNLGQLSVVNGTTLPSIGRHVVGNAEQISADQWTLTRQGFDEQFIRGFSDTQTTIKYRSLQLDAPTQLSVVLDSYAYQQDVRIFQLQTPTVLGERVTPIVYDYDFEQRTNAEFVLPAGSYALMVVWTAMLDSEIVAEFDGTFEPTNQPEEELEFESVPQTHSLTLQEISPWADKAGQLLGLQVDLDLGDPNSPLFEVIANTESSITIESESTLSSVIGQPIIGVREFDTITVRGGAYLNLGADRVIVNNPSSMVIDDNSTLSVGEFNNGTLEVLSEIPQAGTIIQQNQ